MVSIGFVELFDFPKWSKEYLLVEIAVAKMSSNMCIGIGMVIGCTIVHPVARELLLPDVDVTRVVGITQLSRF